MLSIYNSIISVACDLKQFLKYFYNFKIVDLFIDINVLGVEQYLGLVEHIDFI